MLLFLAEIAARMLFPAEEPYWEYARELRLVLMLAAVVLLARITQPLYVVRVAPILTAIGVWLFVKLSWVAGGVSVDGVGGSSDLGRRAALAVGLNIVFPLAFAIPLLIWDVKERSARPGVFLAAGVALGIVGVVLQRAAEGDTLFVLSRAAAFQMSWLASGAAFGLAGCEAVQSLAKRRWALGVGAGAVALGITVMPVLKAWTYYLGGWLLFE